VKSGNLTFTGITSLIQCMNVFFSIPEVGSGVCWEPSVSLVLLSSVGLPSVSAADQSWSSALQPHETAEPSGFSLMFH